MKKLPKSCLWILLIFPMQQALEYGCLLSKGSSTLGCFRQNFRFDSRFSIWNVIILSAYVLFRLLALHIHVIHLLYWLTLSVLAIQVHECCNFIFNFKLKESFVILFSSMLCFFIINFWIQCSITETITETRLPSKLFLF